MIRCGWQVFADGFLDFRIFQLKSSLFGKKSSFSYLFAVLEMGLSRAQKFSPFEQRLSKVKQSCRFDRGSMVEIVIRDSIFHQH